MNYVDIVILMFLAFGAILGFSRGFTKQLVCLLGIYVVIILSFILKNPVSVFLYTNLPFFKLGGVEAFNVLIYETIAFFIVFFILLIIYRSLLKITNLFEKILKATIVLAIPSKILGALLGIIQNIIYVFIILYILNLPIFNFKPINESKIANDILKYTPVLNVICNDALSTFNDIINLKKEYKNTNNTKQYNQEIVNKMIENGIITKENVKKLIKQNKLKSIEI